MAIAVVVALTCAALLKIYVLDPQREAAEGSGNYKPPSLLSLPGKDVDAGLIFGHVRADVLKLLGAPVEATLTADTFRPGPGLIVKYANDIASTIIVEWPDIGRHERYARRWLHLAGDGPLAVGDIPLRIVKFVGHDERFGIEVVVPFKTPVVERATHKSAATAPLPTVDTLLRTFPELSENARRACHAVGRTTAAVLACSGFDGAVSYDVTVEERLKSLTVLDPSTAKTEEDCRAFLTRTRPDLVTGAKSEERGGRKVVHFTSPGVDAQYVWLSVTPVRKTPSCSVMVCNKEEAGVKNSCTR